MPIIFLILNWEVTQRLWNTSVIECIFAYKLFGFLRFFFCFFFLNVMEAFLISNEKQEVFILVVCMACLKTVDVNVIS